MNVHLQLLLNISALQMIAIAHTEDEQELRTTISKTALLNSAEPNLEFLMENIDRFIVR